MAIDEAQFSLDAEAIEGLKPAASSDDQPEALQNIRKKVLDDLQISQRDRARYTDTWERLYGEYNNSRRLIHDNKVNPRDRDESDTTGLNRAFGGPMWIPLQFWTVESLIPRIVSRPPRMIVRPNREDAGLAAAPIRDVLMAQQSQIGWEMKLQETVRRGVKYGLGVQKTFWAEEKKTVLQPVYDAAGSLVAQEEEIVHYRGPDCESIDIFDFFWDPAAKDIDTSRFAIQRLWRPYSYVCEMVKSGKWFPIDLESAKGWGTPTGRSSVWAGRLQAAGIDQTGGDQGNLHEVLEWHDGQRVWTLLDQKIVVVANRSPAFHREMPFQIFRPILQEGEFVGKGIMEPQEDLQIELNTLRQQRRDNATMKLMPPRFYQAGSIPNPEDLLKVGPRQAIKVFGPPHEVMHEVPVGDIPGSSYKEGDEIKRDAERTSGVGEGFAGGGFSSETATGVQVEEAALGERVALMAKNLMWETVRPAARQFFSLNRQYAAQIGSQTVRVDDPHHRAGYRFVEVSPQDWLADLDVTPDADSTTPENEPTRIANATALFNQLAGSPIVNQSEAVMHLLRANSVVNAEEWIQPDMTDPTETTRLVAEELAAAGVPEDVIEDAVVAAFDQIEQGQSQNGAAPPAEPEQPQEV